MDSEIIRVPLMETIWWDLDKDCETSAPTGTPYAPAQRVQQRVVERVWGQLIHWGCGGRVTIEFSTRWEGSRSYTTWWKECEDCHKKFDIEEEE